MESSQIAVDFQTDSDVVRLHITLFDAESEEEDMDDSDSDGDTIQPDRGESSGVWDDDDQCEGDDGHINPKKRRKRPNKKRSVGKKKSRIGIRGGQGTAAEATTVIDTWSNLITQSIIDKIVTSTNNNMDKVRPNFSRERDAAPTNSVEIKAFIGLLYMVGIHRGARLSVTDFWDSGGIGIELFRLTMTHRRFRILMRCLGFDESSINESEGDDALESVDRILNEFSWNCRTSYSVGKDVSVDVLQDGRLMHKSFFKSTNQVLDNQPAILALTDSHLLYTYNLQIFTDNEDDEVFPRTDENIKVIEELCEPFVKHVLCINADKRFIKFTTVLQGLSGGGNNSQITFYDPDTKEATPVTTLSNTYDVYVLTKRWAVTAFFQMLNVAGINSQIIYTGNGNIVKNRRTFLRQLAMDLTKEHLARRGSSVIRNTLPCSLQARLLAVTNQTSIPPSDNKRRLCHVCVREDKSRKSTKYRCTTCGMYLCLGHVTVMCRGCYLVASQAVKEMPEFEYQIRRS